jgi:hypothetical protein
MPKPVVASHPLALLTMTLAFLALIHADRAQAQNVVNPSFEIPSVAQTATGYIVDPPFTPQVGWTFSLLPAEPGATVRSNSGVQNHGTGFDGPPAPDGSQTGYITNLGSIEQKVDFKKSGDYTLSFKIAASAADVPNNQSGGILVYIAGQKNGPYTPKSNSSFNEVTIAFKVAQSNSSIDLKFVGYGLGNGGQFALSEVSAVFIDAVSIKAVAPQIASGPPDLDPTSKIKLTGSHFGADKGKFRIHFPSESAVSFGSKSGNSKKDLTLDVDGTWSDDGTITSEQILAASPVGSVPEQTVDITVIAADGQTSNAVQAKFHNNAVITGETGFIIPSGLIKLTGWDFGEAGELVADFPIPSAQDLSPNSRTKLILEIPSPTDKSWLSYAIKAKVPAVAGSNQQPVLVSFTTKDKRKSNVWPVLFMPTMEVQLLPGQAITVGTCSDQGVYNGCNGIQNGDGLCFPGFEPWVNFTTGGPVFSFGGIHWGCFGFDSDNGTDVYLAKVTNGWTITSFGSIPISENNASVGFQPSPLPNQAFVVSVPWHIGATGGVVYYDGEIMIKGPKGVPYLP